MALAEMAATELNGLLRLRGTKATRAEADSLSEGRMEELEAVVVLQTEQVPEVPAELVEAAALEPAGKAERVEGVAMPGTTN